jgi:hypothetical protein
VSQEYRRVFRPPFEIPLALVGNAALLTVAWFLLPPRAHDWMFALHGPLAFPVILASWMLGDTPATNVIAADVPRAMSVLEDEEAFRTWLLARTVVLTTLVGLPTAIVALVLGFEGQPAAKVAATCVVLVILPFGVLPITSWLGLLLPYHVRPLRWRWAHRKQLRQVVRWVLLLTAPFVVVPAVSVIVVLPSLAVAHWLFGAPHHPLTNVEFLLVAVSVCATALVTGLLGLSVAARLRRHRSGRLAGYLQDPTAG